MTTEEALRACDKVGYAADCAMEVRLDSALSVYEAACAAASRAREAVWEEADRVCDAAFGMR